MENEWYIKRRIATPDGSYPASEAEHISLEAYIAWLEEQYDMAIKDLGF